MADNLLARMSPKVNQYYQTQMDKMRAMAASVAQTGLPPEKVAEVIERALTARRPKMRYPVGTDARIGINVIARLPDRLLAAR